MRELKRASMVAALVAAAAMSSCKPKPDEAAVETPATAPVAAPGGEATALLAEPRLKAGLWQMTLSADGAATPAYHICFGPGMGDKISIFGASRSSNLCPEATVGGSVAGGLTFHSLCDRGSGGRQEANGITRITQSGGETTAFSTDLTTVTTGAAVPQMNRVSTLKTQAKWTSVCPAGWTTGDMELPGMEGKRINALKTVGAAPGLGGM